MRYITEKANEKLHYLAYDTTIEIKHHNGRRQSFCRQKSQQPSMDPSTGPWGEIIGTDSVPGIELVLSSNAKERKRQLQ